jgi:hypothetical protein
VGSSQAPTFCRTMLHASSDERSDWPKFASSETKLAKSGTWYTWHELSCCLENEDQVDRTICLTLSQFLVQAALPALPPSSRPELVFGLCVQVQAGHAARGGGPFQLGGGPRPLVAGGAAGVPAAVPAVLLHQERQGAARLPLRPPPQPPGNQWLTPQLHVITSGQSPGFVYQSRCKLCSGRGCDVCLPGISTTFSTVECSHYVQRWLALCPSVHFSKLSRGGALHCVAESIPLLFE